MAIMSLERDGCRCLAGWLLRWLASRDVHAVAGEVEIYASFDISAEKLPEEAD
jgi:hypothetical protein